MKLLLLAISFSIALHFIILTTYKTNEEVIQPNKIEKETSSKITYVKLKEKEIKIEKTVEKPVVEKTVHKKPITNKKIQAKKIIKQEVQKIQNKVLKEQIVHKNSSIQNKTLESFLSQESSMDDKILNEIDFLYKKEFETFTNVQKVFIKKNLNRFRQITQRVLNRLGYPPIAKKLRLSGENIISFYFHPNGDISELKLTSKSKYEIFDKHTLELIEIAYKDYPKPTTKTKIIFNVRYILY